MAVAVVEHNVIGNVLPERKSYLFLLPTTDAATRKENLTTTSKKILHLKQCFGS